MSKLLLLRQTDYEREGIDAAVRRIFSHFRAPGLIRPGARVLLKVNLVAGHPPQQRVNTDPAVVRSVAERVLELGGRPFIADSPGIEAFKPAAERAGFMEVARELGIPCHELLDSVPLPSAEVTTFKKIAVSRTILESDVILNLPKMKTHGQMLLTLGVKNMFGCIVGQRKAEWHYNVGLNPDHFATLLLDLYCAIAPHLTILDGVIGMDGEGPTSGNPHAFGLIAGARDALTMDFWLARMMGVRLEDFPLWCAANLKGLPQCALDPADLAGDLSPDHTFEGVDIPVLHALSLLPHLPFASLLERFMTSRPVHVPELCIGCGKCEAVCVAKALQHTNRKLTFDYRKCIRCYCCHEMCPVKAITFQESFLLALTRRLRRLRHRFKNRK